MTVRLIYVERNFPEEYIASLYRRRSRRDIVVAARKVNFVLSADYSSANNSISEIQRVLERKFIFRKAELCSAI